MKFELNSESLRKKIQEDCRNEQLFYSQEDTLEAIEYFSIPDDHLWIL